MCCVCECCLICCFLFFFFNDTATTEIYTLSLHDALPIFPRPWPWPAPRTALPDPREDRKSTRLNSSHVKISYAVFCLKKKNKIFISVIVSKNKGTSKYHESN